MSRIIAGFLAALSLMLWGAQAAYAQDAKAWIPPELKGWEGWVLHGRDAALCPPLATDPAQRQCLFPTRAALACTASGAAFTQVFRVFAPQNVPLVAAQGLWPEGVTVNGQPAPVLDLDGAPGVRLTPGEWQVAGRLAWAARPATLSLPAQTGVVELSVDGQPVPNPRLRPDGALELAASGQDAQKDGQAEGAAITVMRLLRDGQPMTLTTLVRLEVTGRFRVVTLDGVLPPGTTPFAVNSPVPVGFGLDGRLLVQAGAGRHDVEVVNRFPGPVAGVGPLNTPFGNEVWAVAADPALRDLQARGLPSVDPRTTALPEAWKRYPAYLAQQGATLTLAEVRRGESRGAGQGLSIRRSVWMDFDGAGLTVRDQLSGPLDAAPSLAMSAPGQLGRASLDGRDQPVVLLGGQRLPGVELRRSPVYLTAESRYPDARAAVPASGWQTGAAALSAEVQLPPGWRALHVAGPDAAWPTWVAGWDLFGIFLTLFLSLAAWKLRGVGGGLALLGFLILARYEPGAPVQAWIPLLAVLGLQRLLGDRPWPRAARLLRMGYGLSLAALAVMSLAFAAGQATTALYPQLEDRSDPVSVVDTAMRMMDAAPEMATVGAPPPSPAPMAAQEAAPLRAQKAAPGKGPRGGVAQEEPGRDQSLEPDPDSLVQTGPGLPGWQWRSVRLTWTGPVDPAQTFRLVLLPPWATSLACWARIALLGAALALLAGVRPGRNAGRATAAAAGVLVALAFVATPSQTRAEPPSRELLEELAARLTKPSDCFPNCAGVSRMHLALDAKGLRLALDAGAATRLALPLPVVGGWRPQAVTLDGKPASLFARDGGVWVLLPEGAHRVEMSGPAPREDAFTVSAPFPVRLASAQAPGWNVQGVSPDGALEGSLRLSRLDTGAAQAKPVVSAVIPPFLELTRALELGHTWQARYTLKRLTPAEEPLSLTVPLLEGESVLDGDARQEGSGAVVSLAAGRAQASWATRLEVRPRIELSAARDAPWVEIWRLSAAPQWDVALSGIPVTASLDQRGQWSPLWRPWPGEQAAVEVTRPGPAPGRSLTIDRAALTVTPGPRLDEAVLTVRLRASLGGRQELRLPAEAQVTAVTLDGQPVQWAAPEPGRVAFGLTPGGHDIAVRWRQPREGLTTVQTPSVSLGDEAVNFTASLEMPRDRWVLRAFGDTPLAPAVRIWSAVALAALAALVLGRLGLTPLGPRGWFILALGLTQVEAGVALTAVLWLFALGIRRKRPPQLGWFWFDAAQVGFGLLCLAGLLALLAAVRTGLLGLPDMHVAGNGSTAYHLVWTFDRVGAMLPQAGAWSLSLWWYRGLMLVWSLWLAWSLLGWLRWGVGCMGEGGGWKSRPPRVVKTPEGQG